MNNILIQVLAKDFVAGQEKQQNKAFCVHETPLNKPTKHIRVTQLPILAFQIHLLVKDATHCLKKRVVTLLL